MRSVRVPSLRNRLLRDVTLTVVVLAAAIIVVSMLAARRAVTDLSELVIERTIGQAASELERFLQPLEPTVLAGQGWVVEGLADVDRPDAFARLALPLLEANPSIVTVLCADERGREVLVGRRDGGWLRRERPGDDAEDGRTRHRRWIDDPDDPDDATESLQAIDYDPRTRPWFRESLALLPADGAESDLHWTEPYTFFSAREPGITVARAFRGPDGGVRVVAVDILLTAICEFTTGMRLGERGLVVVLTADGRVLGLPGLPEFQDRSRWRDLVMREPSELGWPLIGDLSRARRAVPMELGRPVRFPSGGEDWWAELVELPLAANRALRLAVAVPEAELVGGLALTRNLLLVLLAALLGGAVVRVYLLASRLSRPIEQLVLESDRISRGVLDEPVESPPVMSEIESLQSAHRRMRAGLRQLLRMERDLQIAAQIQRQALPESWPRSPRFDIAAWNEPADETGGDTYDVIGSTARRDGGPVRLTVGDDAERVHMVLADATGHGVGPALAATNLKAMIRMAVRLGAPLDRLVEQVNRQLVLDLPSDRFITAWMAELDLAKGELHAYSAGQAPILVYRAKTRTIESQDADCPPLGLVDDLGPISPRRIALEPGDVLAVISDGIFEARDPDDALFGDERVRRVLHERASTSADDLIAALRDAVRDFVRGRPPADDQTMVIVKRRG